MDLPKAGPSSYSKVSGLSTLYLEFSGNETRLLGLPVALMACPFLREDPESGDIVCIVHRTRPEICREYRCWRLLVQNAAGVRAGRVMERRHLAADDPALKAFWEEKIAGIREGDIDRWDEQVILLLKGAGYTVYW